MILGYSLRRDQVQSCLFGRFGFLAAAFLLILACGRPPGFGAGGRYLDAKQELVNTRTGDVQKAIGLLESVAVEDALYKDTLTLLGKAYYKAGRYRDALQILKRALAVNDQDKIAWIVLGLTQLQTGDDANGLESFKGGITLLSQATKNGYKGIEDWDKRGMVRGAIRRAVFAAAKGLEEKQAIIKSGEMVLARIDQEERLGKMEQEEERRVGY